MRRRPIRAEIRTTTQNAPNRSTQAHGGCRSGRTKDIVPVPLWRKGPITMGRRDVDRRRERRRPHVRRIPLGGGSRSEGVCFASITAPQHNPVCVRLWGGGMRADTIGIRIPGTHAVGTHLTRMMGLRHLLHERPHRTALQQHPCGEKHDDESRPPGCLNGREVQGHIEVETETPKFTIFNVQPDPRIARRRQKGVKGCQTGVPPGILLQRSSPALHGIYGTVSPTAPSPSWIDARSLPI